MSAPRRTAGGTPGCDAGAGCEAGANRSRWARRRGRRRPTEWPCRRRGAPARSRPTRPTALRLAPHRDERPPLSDRPARARGTNRPRRRGASSGGRRPRADLRLRPVAGRSGGRHSGALEPAEEGRSHSFLWAGSGSFWMSIWVLGEDQSTRPPRCSSTCSPSATPSPAPPTRPKRLKTWLCVALQRSRAGGRRPRGTAGTAPLLRAAGADEHRRDAARVGARPARDRPSAAK